MRNKPGSRTECCVLLGAEAGPVNAPNAPAQCLLYNKSGFHTVSYQTEPYLKCYSCFPLAVCLDRGRKDWLLSEEQARLLDKSGAGMGGALGFKESKRWITASHACVHPSMGPLITACQLTWCCAIHHEAEGGNIGRTSGGMLIVAA